MNLRAELSLVLAGQAAVPSGLLFRPADALRLEGCVAALLREGKSLALAGSHDAALGHYADLLIERLRQAAGCPVEVYFPASTQAMVARFDELLAGMTVQEALTERSGRGPQRIWLVHDAGALAEHELALLARLVGQFPGAGVAVVLLLGPGLRSRKALEALGRRFLRWDIEPPTPEQAQAMRELARAQGFEPLVSQLLRHVQPAAPAVPAAPAELRAEPRAEPPEPVRHRRWRLRGRRRPLLLAGSALMFLAVFTGAWLMHAPPALSFSSLSGALRAWAAWPASATPPASTPTLAAPPLPSGLPRASTEQRT